MCKTTDAERRRLAVKPVQTAADGSSPVPSPCSQTPLVCKQTYINALTII